MHNIIRLFTLFLTTYILHSATVLAQTAQNQANAINDASPTNSKAIYKRVNSDGTVTYTDQPASKAMPMAFDDKTLNVVSAAKIPSVLTPSTLEEKPQYRVVIVSPSPEATVRNNIGEVIIYAKQTGTPTAPLYRLIFDGAPYKSNSSGQFKLTDVHRGTHTFKIELTDNSGKALASSPIQTLYLHRASALIKN